MQVLKVFSKFLRLKLRYRKRWGVFLPSVQRLHCIFVISFWDLKNFEQIPLLKFLCV